jgi:predicted ATP-dependent endonuclease of OLD family
VTQHIKSVWKNHPIEITFPISGDTINFHITDLNSDSKAKKTNQRSDGFKQFISFLLTISAEKVQGELTNKIILLNEPETHLHPQAQIDFLKEMCELTKKGNNLLLYSTHSNHLIDRKNITKMLRVNKVGDKTDVQKIKGNSFSYARVNYEVFNIATTDYHNELYGLLYQRAIDDETESSLNIKEFDSNYFVTKLKQAKKHPWKAQANQVSLHTYIRNCIHHPENPDYKFSVEDLESSVGFLHSLVWQSSAVKP